MDDKLFDLLMEWEDRRRGGAPASAEQLCQAAPEQLEALERQIRAIESMERLLEVSVVEGATLPFHDGPPLETSRSTGPQHGFEREIEGYEILEILDEGGMGVVYKARQKGLDRLVALKTISGPRVGASRLARFEREAQAIARLRHPHIVQIHHVGEHNGRPFFTMELVEGGDLARRLESGPLEFDQGAALVEKLALAIETAHEQGVVHRDLKPSNVLLTKDGEPKISDFGLAKRLDLDERHTQPGEILGTPSYMAPEQAEGRIDDIGPLTDVYALGGILYELLCGQPPFRGPTPFETLRMVRASVLAPPRHLTRRVPPELEAIATKCLEKKPSDRYTSAKALALDLSHYRQGLPISARPLPAWRRAIRWVRRRPAAAALFGLAILTAWGSVLAGSMAWRTHRRAHELAVQQAPVAQEILVRHCAECHNPARRERELDVLDYAGLFAGPRPLVVPESPHDSRLLQRIEDGSMPPENEEQRLPRLTEEELTVLREWVAGGAPPFPPLEDANVEPKATPDLLLAARVKDLFIARCYECHQYSEAKGGIKILNYRLLVTTRKVVVPRDAQGSELFQLVQKEGKGRMPPEPEKPLSAAEVELIREWIDAGAPPFPKGAEP